MKENIERIKYNIINIASRFFICYKNYLLVFFIVFLFGFLTGIFTCSQYSSDLTCENLINKYLYNFLCNEMNFFTYFLILSLFFLLISVLTMILIRNKFTVIVNIFAMFLMSYVFGFDLCIIVVCLGLAGIILGILFLGILGVGVFGAYISIMSIVCSQSFRKDTCCTFKSLFANCFVFVLIAIILLFFSSLFFSIIHIFVIID